MEWRNYTASVNEEGGKWGGYLNAYIDAAFAPENENLKLGDFDFTVDFWAKNVDSRTENSMFYFYLSIGSSLLSCTFQHSEKNSYNHKITLSTENYANSTQALSTMYDGNFHHCAFVFIRDEFKLIFFLDGVGLYSHTISQQNQQYLSAQDFYFYIKRAHIDELRILPTTALWKENFTPPTEPY